MGSGFTEEEGQLGKGSGSASLGMLQRRGGDVGNQHPAWGIYGVTEGARHGMAISNTRI